MYDLLLQVFKIADPYHMKLDPSSKTASDQCRHREIPRSGCDCWHGANASQPGGSSERLVASAKSSPGCGK